MSAPTKPGSGVAVTAVSKQCETGFLTRWLVFTVWLVAVAIVAWHHEPWADEAQAWLIARDCTLRELFLSRLRIEGHPALWYLALMPLAKAGAPYWTMTMLSVTLTAVGVWLLLFKTRLPLAIAAAVPFSYWYFYQFSVVARSYCLVLPVGLLVIMAYPRRDQRPWLWFGALALFANISAQTLLIASGTVLVETLTALGRAGASNRRNRLLVAVLWLALVGGLACMLYPSPENSSSGSWHVVPLVSLWHLLGGLTYENVGFGAPTSLLAWGSLLVSLLLAYALIVWFHKRRLLALLVISTALPVAFAGLRVVRHWHDGILFTWWVILLAFSFETRNSQPSEGLETPAPTRIQPLLALALILALPIQIYWSTSVAVHDIQGPYSGSAAAAAQMRAFIDQGASVDSVGWGSNALMPYLDARKFAGYWRGNGKAVWLWSIYNTAYDENLQGLCQKGLDVIIVFSTSFPPDATISQGPFAPPYGYKVIAVNRSGSYYKDTIGDSFAYVIYAKNALARDSVIDAPRRDDL